MHIIAICLQGIRIAVPAGLILSYRRRSSESFLESMPVWLTDGLAIGGGMVVAVGYAMVNQHDGNKEVWPFFALSVLF